jgi:hypothetical protein
MKKIRVYIDMDHTFCDFNSSLAIWKDFALTETESKWPWSMPGFFSSMKPMPGALEFWNEFYDKCDLWFLTRPSIQNRHCYTEKADWIYRYLGEKGVEKLILSPRKDLLIGDILIDDFDNCGQPTFLGEWWRFGYPTIPGYLNCIDWAMATERLNKKLIKINEKKS